MLTGSFWEVVGIKHPGGAHMGDIMKSGIKMRRMNIEAEKPYLSHTGKHAWPWTVWPNIFLFFSWQLCRGPCLYSFCSSVSSISLSTVSKSGMFFSSYVCPVLQPLSTHLCASLVLCPSQLGWLSLWSLHWHMTTCPIDSIAFRKNTRAPSPPKLNVKIERFFKNKEPKCVHDTSKYERKTQRLGVERNTKWGRGVCKENL